ncbi:MAG: hypothetical protein ACK5L6_03950 [Anaerorhabdus sp.]|uniref:hypothetical protein n=1 Tax=Anaerorhabdus sp. TaxID=1872524 RepID=UPI003A8A2901
MSNLVTIPYYQGALSVDDLSNLLAVKMFLPFTNDLLDKSESHQTVTNVGNTILSDKGANFNGSQRLDTTFKFSIGKTYTVEFIYNGDTTTVGTFIGGGATSGLVIGKENGNLAITGAGGNLVSIESISAYSNKETSYQLIIKIVSSTSLTVDMYVNGSLIIANKSITLSTGLVETTAISIGALNTGGTWYRYLNGVLGGVKIIERALSPSQFTLLRPMQMPYPTFNVGEKDYVFISGVWNPKFTVTGNTFIINDQGQLNKDGQATINSIINKTIYVEFIATFAVYANGSIDEVAMYFPARVNSSVSCLSKKITSGNVTVKSDMNINSTNLVITKIWIE